MKTFCIALFLLSLSLLPTSLSLCSDFTLETETFNVCQFTTVLGVDTVIDGTLSFSLGEPIVPNCGTPTTNIWGKLEDGLGDCFDVAIDPPDISLLDPNNVKTGGLRIKYPVYRSSPSDTGFELEILLHCAPGQMNTTNDTFSLTKMFGQGSTDVTTYTISSFSEYGCAKYTGCPPQNIYNSYYKLCALNATNILNVTDPLGGHLAFNLGGTPKVLGCSWPHETDYIFGNYYANSGECFAASSKVGPTYSLLTSWNPSDGLLLEYHYPYSTMRNLILQIKLKLLCNPTAIDANLIVPTVDVTYQQYYLTFDLIAESAYACPIV